MMPNILSPWMAWPALFWTSEGVAFQLSCWLKSKVQIKLLDDASRRIHREPRARNRDAKETIGVIWWMSAAAPLNSPNQTPNLGQPGSLPALKKPACFVKHQRFFNLQSCGHLHMPPWSGIVSQQAQENRTSARSSVNSLWNIFQFQRQFSN